MGQFRKKPVEVEARQVPIWDDDPETANIENYLDESNVLSDWCDGTGHMMDDEDPHITISTHEGDMRAEPGDWIIKEPFPTDDRKFYPCKPEMFEATYESVES